MRKSELSGNNNSESSLKLVMGNARVQQEQLRAKAEMEIRRQ